ncbi:MAG: DUF3048 domain-containing protein [Acidimicrobiales bacterium]
MTLGRGYRGWAWLVWAGVLLAGCSSGPPASTASLGSPPTSSAEAPTTTVTSERYPLTGQPATDERARERPALAVKIDNIAAARPQAGLDAADVIYEELAEGGLTRFVAVFHSTDAALIGPVRSVRPSDLDIVAPLDPLFAYSGGAPAVLAMLPSARLTDVGFDRSTPAYTRRPDRRSPQNLYSSTARLYSESSGAPSPPGPLAEFTDPGQPFAASGAARAGILTLAAGPTVRADYAWDPVDLRWKRFTDGAPHLLESGRQIAPANVIVQFTEYSPFLADAKVSVAEVVGSGQAWILSGGMVARGGWSKSSPTAVTRFSDAGGAPIRLAPGPTLIHLVAPGTPVATT